MESEDDSHVKVVVRIRPLNDAELSKEKTAAVKCISTKELSTAIQYGGKKALKTYSFDAVFDEKTSQAALYESVGQPTVKDVLMGFNCVIFAYGQTGTGKTFTMEGQENLKERANGECQTGAQAGVVPRAVEQIFTYLENLNATEYTVRVSGVEIYNEELTDLLASSDQKHIRLLEDPKKGVIVCGAEERTVQNASDIYSILELCQSKRRTAETQLNQHSSRSHSIFTIKIFMKETQSDGEDVIKTGTLNLVDLAGSENVGRSGASGQRKTEAGAINQSLLTLGRVITALVEHQPHVPYRESKLTRLLQESLGGRTKTCIIATVSPSSGCLEETVSTLEYAFRAKNIRNRPEINQMMSKKVLVRELNKRIATLEEELQAQREKNGVFLPADRYNELQQASSANGAKVEQLESLLQAKHAELESVQTLFRERHQQLENMRVAHIQTQNILDETTAKLSQTNEKLKDTKVVLAERTEIGRDLRNHGVHLLQVSDSLKTDVGVLFGKIEREERVMAVNSKLAAEYHQSINTQLMSCVSDLSGFQQSQKETLQRIQDFATEFATQTQTNMAKMQKDIETLHKLLGDTVSARTLESRRMEETVRDMTESATAMSSRHRAALESSCSAWETKINEQCRKSHEEAAQWSQKLIQWRDTLCSQVDRCEEATSAFADRQCSVLGAIAQQVEEQTQMLTDKSVELDKMVEDVRRTQEEQCELETQELMKQVEAAIRNATKTSRESWNNRLDSVHTHTAQTTKHAIASNAAVTQLLQTAQSSASSYAHNHKTNSATQQRSAIDSLVNECQSAVKASECCASEIVGCWRGSKRSIEETATAHRNEYGNLVGGLAARSTQWTALTLSECSTVERSHNDVTSSLGTAAHAYQQQAQQLCTDVTSSVASARNSSDVFACEHNNKLARIASDKLSLKEYVPTKMTPVKKDFVLPSALPVLRSEEEILSCFKAGGRNVMANDASTPPSPHQYNPLFVTSRFAFSSPTAKFATSNSSIQEELDNIENINANILPKP